MKKLIIGVLMAGMLMASCTGCGVTKHTTITVTGAGANEKTVYEYIDGELQSITNVTYVVSTGNEAN